MAEMVVARNQAEIMQAEAEAEELAGREEAQRRTYELEWERLNVMRKLAANGPKVIITDAATIMEHLNPADDSR